MAVSVPDVECLAALDLRGVVLATCKQGVTRTVYASACVQDRSLNHRMLQKALTSAEMPRWASQGALIIRQGTECREWQSVPHYMHPRCVSTA